MPRFPLSVFSVGPPNQIVQRHVIEVCQLDRQLQGERPLPAFVFGVKGLVTEQEPGNLFLREIRILPQIPNPKVHMHHRCYYNICKQHYSDGVVSTAVFVSLFQSTPSPKLSEKKRRGT